MALIDEKGDRIVLASEVTMLLEGCLKSNWFSSVSPSGVWNECIHVLCHHIWYRSQLRAGDQGQSKGQKSGIHLLDGISGLLHQLDEDFDG